MNPICKCCCRLYQTAFRLALPLLPYREPRPIETMDALPALFKEQNVSRVLLVTDEALYAAGAAKPLEDILAAGAVTCAVYHGASPNPTVQQVEDAAAAYRAADAQAMIALGGGSSMDCAKAAGARIVRPGLPVQNMGGLLKIRRKTPLLVAIPTTAGSGSETTLAAVITDPAAHYKYPINDFVLIPDYAVLDYRVTVSLPPDVTAATGMDALTHAVEAYIGRSTTALTRAMAEEAVTLIVRYLRRAYEDGADAEARTGMLRAAYCAGIAFTRSYVGYVHAVAHSLGGQYGVPHGLANAIILPHFLDRYGSACHAALARLARVSGVSGSTADAEAAAALIAWIKEQNRAMGIGETIDVIEEKDIPAMAYHAAREANPLYPVPLLMDQTELSAMYKELMPKKEAAQ